MLYFKIPDLFSAAKVLLSTFPNDANYPEYFTVPLGLEGRVLDKIGSEGYLLAEVKDKGDLYVTSTPTWDMPSETWDSLNSLLFGLFFSGENNRGPFTATYQIFKPRPGKGTPPSVATRVMNGDIHDVMFLSSLYGFDFTINVGDSVCFPQCPAPVHVRLTRSVVVKGEAPAWALATEVSHGKGEAIKRYGA